ncbi:hypothetical protein O3P69_000553 [Scylla paramamosain]|uniref:Uncharacterized protein n=1 Tax=Scylla paramamosain TaxID=85552 RepID=A0AAW0UTU6_SCYPA
MPEQAGGSKGKNKCKRMLYNAAIRSRATKISVSPCLALPRASHPMAALPQPLCSALQVAGSLRNTVVLGKPCLENIKQRPGASPLRDTCLWRRHGNVLVKRGCHRRGGMVAAVWRRLAGQGRHWRPACRLPLAHHHDYCQALWSALGCGARLVQGAGVSSSPCAGGHALPPHAQPGYDGVTH